jgi:hypothetical protein
MSDTQKTVTLEYIGPARQEWHDGDKSVQLVAGRRYPVEATLAAYMVEHDTGHWKRPDSPKPAAVKE